MKESLKISMLILGTIIGAGFASGREIITFFGKFGYGAYPLIILAGVLFFIFIYAFLRIGARVKSVQLQDANAAIFGKFSFIANILVMLNYILVIAAMLSGSDALIEDMTGLPILSIATMVLAAIFVSVGIKGLKGVSAVLIPALILLTGITCIWTICMSASSMNTAAHLPSAENSVLQIINCLLYVGMNIFLASGVLTSVELDKKTIIKASFISSVAITALMLLILSAVFVSPEMVFNASMPILNMAVSLNIGVVALIIIWLAIFTTLIGSVYVVSNWLLPVIHYRAAAVCLVLIIGWLLGRQGFQNVVNVTYPISGLFGIIYSAFALFYLTRIRVKEIAGVLPKKLRKTAKAVKKTVKPAQSVSEKDKHAAV